MTLYQISEYLSDGRCVENFLALVEPQQGEKTTDEEWRFVVTPKFSSQDYIVSDHGRVISLPRYREYEASPRSQVKHRKFLPGRVMQPGKQPSGHLTITITYEKTKFSTHVHRLVAWAFHGPQPPESFVRHLDGNPSNNRLDNLAYGTPWENIQDTYGPAGVTGIGIIVGTSLERRIEAALAGEADPAQVLYEIAELLTRSRNLQRNH